MRRKQEYNYLGVVFGLLGRGLKVFLPGDTSITAAFIIKGCDEIMVVVFVCVTQD